MKKWIEQHLGIHLHSWEYAKGAWNPVGLHIDQLVGGRRCKTCNHCEVTWQKSGFMEYYEETETVSSERFIEMVDI